MIAVTLACQGCGACLLTCPERAIRPVRDAIPGAGPLAVLETRCTGCGECVEICPADAIEFTAAGDWPAARRRTAAGRRTGRLGAAGCRPGAGCEADEITGVTEGETA
ncbi:MAG TPA: 4Fe-4S dicluster domain-containing protein [Streptosporangiaceae bacterium]|nr:4Fe-4S dicluster domain-containing protein [Streptosporangiaceae bacterium]